MNEAAETLVPAQIKMRLMRWRVRVARWLMLPELDSDAAHGLRRCRPGSPRWACCNRPPPW